MKVQVIDMESKKVIWEEDHKNPKELDRAIEQLKENNFNPNHFEFKKVYES